MYFVFVVLVFFKGRRVCIPVCVCLSQKGLWAHTHTTANMLDTHDPDMQKKNKKLTADLHVENGLKSKL